MSTAGECHSSMISDQVLSVSSVLIKTYVALSGRVSGHCAGPARSGQILPLFGEQRPSQQRPWQLL